MRKIKVMHIVLGLGVGGMETVLVEMLKAFDRSRFQTYVCCLMNRGELAADLEKAGIEVFSIERKSRFDLSIIFKMKRLFRENGIDIVHTYSGVYRDGAIAARLAKVPVVLHTDQGKIYTDGHFTEFYHRVLSNYFRNKVIAVSENLKQYLTKEIGIRSDKIAVMPNSVRTDIKLKNFARNAYRERLGLSKNDLVFGIVARLVPVKDHDTLIEASAKVFKKIPNAELLIIGNGPLQEVLERKVKDLDIADKVIFLGKRRDIPELLSILDLFVLSSRHEGISLSILEAMAQGIPVVATRVGGNSEVIENGSNGLLVESKNPEALAKGIIALLKDSKKRMEFGRRGRAIVCEKFDLKTNVRRYEELYTSYFQPENKKIKVMHLASNPEWAGAEVHLATLVDSLKKDRRVDVSVSLFHNGKLADYLKEHDVEVSVINLKWLFDISSIFRLARLLRKENIDILHTHGYKANVIGVMAALLSRKTICVRTEHGHTEPFRGFAKSKMNFYEALDYIVGRFFTKKIIAVSFDIMEKAANRYRGKSIYAIHNGIDIAYRNNGNGDRLKSELGINKESMVIGIVGRLVPVKGHRYFIEAAKAILTKRRDVHFLIVGDGPLRDELESLVPLELSEYFRFTGFRDDAKDLMGIMDIVVFSSLNEGIPYTLLEAMLEKKAIVAAKVGGLAEVIFDGKNGLLVKSQDAAEITERCLYLLEHKTARRYLGEEAKRTVIEDFSVETMKEETIHLYEESLLKG